MSKLDEIRDDYYTMRQTCEVLGRSRTAVYHYIDIGILAAYKFVGRKYFKKKEVDNLYRNHLVKTSK